MCIHLGAFGFGSSSCCSLLDRGNGVIHCYVEYWNGAEHREENESMTGNDGVDSVACPCIEGWICYCVYCNTHRE